MSEPSQFASASVSRHLIRGTIGFGLIGAGLGLTVVIGPAALLLAPAGLVALRGCPMCWTVGLVETISSGRLKRQCSGEGCRIQFPAETSEEGHRDRLVASRGDPSMPRH
jgi:hypothetical protein